MKIRHMSLSDLEKVLGWARSEGWNPGLSDAAAFLAADPMGFFLAEVEGTPAAAISVVNHDALHSFLGLYICAPAFRGQGIGLATWQKALEHAGSRTVTLDGVPAQQQNYHRSGFEALGKTVRYRGVFPLAEQRQRQTDALDALISADARAVGHMRPAFAHAWFAGDRDRVAYRLDAPSDAFAVMRRCADGFKIGPFHASTEAEATELLRRRPLGDADAPLFIDVPSSSGAMTRLLEGAGFLPVFETARMVRGAPAATSPPDYYAVATLELG